MEDARSTNLGEREGIVDYPSAPTVNRVLLREPP